MTTRTNWILAIATLAAAAWGFTGCAAHAPATVEQAENVGQLAPSYHSIAVAPIHHDAPPEMGQLAGSDSDDVSSTVTTVVRAGEADAAPEVQAKGGGLNMGGR